MKSLSLIAFSLFIFSGLYAQDTEKTQPNFWWGPKVGVDLLTPTVDQNSIEAQIESNYQIGLFMQFGRKFYIQPEAYYVTQKESQGSSSETTINTLRVPLMLGMKLINLEVISAHLMAGPSLSYLLKESASDPANPREKTNFALQGGAGADLFGFVTLDVRYSVDLNGSTKTQIEQLRWDSGVNVTLGIKLR